MMKNKLYYEGQTRDKDKKEVLRESSKQKHKGHWGIRRFNWQRCHVFSKMKLY